MGQEKIPEAPSVFDYADFRRFLEHWYTYKKRANPRFSHRGFARRVGTRDPSVLAHVIAGRRDLPRTRVADFCRAMDLDEEESTYFALMVKFGQSRDPEARRRAWAAMAGVRMEQTGPTLEPQNASLRSSKLVALMSLAECPRFRPDPEWIASMFEPPISVEAAAEALAILTDEGMLEPSPFGTRPAIATRQTEVETRVTLDQRYHLDNLEHGRQLLTRMLNEDPNSWGESAFLGFSVAIPAERTDELRHLLWELQLAAMHAAEALGARVTSEGPVQPPGPPSPDADRVYHVNINAFPVTRRIPRAPPRE